VLTVGPKGAYPTPCRAIAAAAPGDIIEIAPGTYRGDVCSWNKDRLTLRGVGERPVIDAAGRNAQGKAIWVIGGDGTVVENVEMRGCMVPDGNGAAIRLEAPSLTIRGSYFHHHQTALLTGHFGRGEILIENSEFAYNGTGTGETHNIYIGAAGRFTMRFSYSHHANEGQLVKSRARENFILYNRLTGEEGNSNYEIDLANGGRSYVIGNVIQQSAATGNRAMLVYQLEGPHQPESSDHLFVVNNTFVSGSLWARFIAAGRTVRTPMVVKNNLFQGSGTLCDGTCVEAGNVAVSQPHFADPSAYDYRLREDSPAIGRGVHPALGDGFSLTPVSEYVHPACGRDRTQGGQLDAGAYQFRRESSPPACQPEPTKTRKLY
jgi:hypothetical protein